MAQRRVSRRVNKGSNRRRKAVKLLQKKHQKIRRQRADFQHKTALKIVRGIKHQRPGGPFGDGFRWGIARTENLHLQRRFWRLGGERQPINCIHQELVRKHPSHIHHLKSSLIVSSTTTHPRRSHQDQESK